MEIKHTLDIVWKIGAVAPLGRAYHTTIYHNGKIYFGGGNERGGKISYEISVYNPIKNVFDQSIETPFSYFAMTTLYNSHLIVAGGKDNFGNISNKVFTVKNCSLKNFTTMTTPRWAATASGHNKALIIVGGRDKTKVLASTEVYDSTTRQWYITSELPSPHHSLWSGITDGVLYLLGGVDQDGKFSQVVYTASLSSHQINWSTQQSIPCCLSAPVSIQGRHLLVLGGSKEIEGRNAPTNDIYMFNKANSKWEVIGQMPLPRSGASAVSITTDKGTVVIHMTGGKDAEGQYADNLFIGLYMQGAVATVCIIGYTIRQSTLSFEPSFYVCPSLTSMQLFYLLNRMYVNMHLCITHLHLLKV